ncbi:amino acid ABC transporter permease [Azospirillum picis]|uniref:General L-amino acid transport system permease protein n=1 Tax=Azospirillum picis TaxID=488438 RepID=A0ABU0MCY8_9PROT|nr:amino acid ABC transporter permease [Azospirillum picis]MBP2297682.1 general L-amino acid transport system permease protein [Azospirillum picis]MDQ0531295.1 general L-amino acid transport system permease protein [Azospirillum picis]
MSNLAKALNSARVRGWLYQGLFLACALAVAWYLVSNTLTNLSTRGVATGFGFLEREAGFEIGESLVSYSASDTYLKALAVGLLNTLAVSAAGVVLATVLGVLIGVARLSSNWMVSRFATLYVETIRNVPLLLQLVVWYTIMNRLPSPREALEVVPHVFLSNRGMKFPVLAEHAGHGWVLLALVAGIAAAIAAVRYGRRRREATGRPFPTLPLAIAAVLLPPVAAFVATGAPLAFDVPELTGFNFEGGGSVTPEFTALLVGLSVYTAGFIAEIVRSGILAVPHGQTEAALALGLKPAQILRLVILPQALRVIVPPLTSQYLNLTKNSSLAVAIGYPDLVSVSNTSANQTGQVVEAVAMMMAVYLIISLCISGFMNWYNRKVALVTR